MKLSLGLLPKPQTEQTNNTVQRYNCIWNFNNILTPLWPKGQTLPLSVKSWFRYIMCGAYTFITPTMGRMHLLEKDATLNFDRTSHQGTPQHLAQNLLTERGKVWPTMGSKYYWSCNCIFAHYSVLLIYLSRIKCDFKNSFPHFVQNLLTKST